MITKKVVSPHDEWPGRLKEIQGLCPVDTPSAGIDEGDAVERLIEPLTTRELEVLERVCDGFSNQEISEQIGINLATVKFHLVNIFGKLGVKRRTQAVAAGIHLGLIEPDWLQGHPLTFGAHARTTAPMETSTYTA